MISHMTQGTKQRKKLIFFYCVQICPDFLDQKMEYENVISLKTFQLKHVHFSFSCFTLIQFKRRIKQI